MVSLDFWPAFLLGCGAFDPNAPSPAQATTTFPLLSTMLPFLASLGRLLAWVSYTISPHWNLVATCRVRGLSDLVVIVGDVNGTGDGDAGDAVADDAGDADAVGDADGVGDADVAADTGDGSVDNRSSRIPAYICLPACWFRTMMR